MPGPNTTGIPTANDIVMGRGDVIAYPLDANDLPTGGGIHLGNCPDFSVGVSTEKAEHFSSMDGLKTRDLLVVLSEQVKLSFVAEEVNEFNVQQFLKGTIGTITNPAVAGFSEINKAYSSVTLGRWYDIVDSNGVHCYNIDATKLTLEKDAVSDVTLVKDTDYELDTTWGRFRLLSTATHIATGDDLNVTLAADGTNTVATYRRVQGLTSVGSKYLIQFIFKDAAHGGKKLKITFYKVSLEPNGDMALITPGGQFAQMKFDCSCEKSTASRYSATPTVSVDWHSAT